MRKYNGTPMAIIRFPKPECRVVRDTAALYKCGRDTVGEFTMKHVAEQPGDAVTARTMYVCYLSWCQAERVDGVTEKTFAKIMAGKGFKKLKSRIRLYTDVRLHTNGFRVVRVNASGILTNTVSSFRVTRADPSSVTIKR